MTRNDKIAAMIGAILGIVFALCSWSHVHAGEVNDVVGSTAYEASHLLKATSGNLYNMTVNYHTAAFRTIMLFDQASATPPGNGATTGCPAGVLNHTSGCMAWCLEGQAQSTDAAETNKPLSWTTVGVPFNFGILVVASTSTSGCSSLTIDGANEWFNAQIK